MRLLQGRDAQVRGAVLAIAIAAPFFLSDYTVSTLLTQALILGIVAASLIYLSAYAGMVSLAQVALYGIAGFMLGNFTTHGTTKGLNLGWPTWAGMIVAFLITVAVSVLLGALSARSVGIYFLMITLTYAVIANLFFGQVETLSGFGGISGITPLSWLGSPNENPERLYWLCLIVALLVYLGLRYSVRTPFGLALQGLRDDPLRMESLGYNVPLHRTLAFVLAGSVAAIGGMLFVWWNGHIDPATIGLASTIDVLVIAVLGGLLKLEGAWIGALFFVLIGDYTRGLDLPSWIDSVLGPVIGGELGERFTTVIGLVFLLIMLVSPDGLTGLWSRLSRRRERRGEGPLLVEEARAESEVRAPP
jgi:branched-chain amino acid transport system permease protein